MSWLCGLGMYYTGSWTLWVSILVEQIMYASSRQSQEPVLSKTIKDSILSDLTVSHQE